LASLAGMFMLFNCIHNMKKNTEEFFSPMVWEWNFVTTNVLTYCEKKFFKWSRKTFVIRDWRPRICKIFKITRIIYSNSERSEQLLFSFLCIIMQNKFSERSKKFFFENLLNIFRKNFFSKIFGSLRNFFLHYNT
jgi:hypothetical protein